MASRSTSCKVHVLAIPLPIPGHTNPMLQFCKRLASRGLKVTLLTMPSTNTSVQHPFNSITVEYLEDDCKEIGSIDTKEGWEAFLARFQATLSNKLAGILEEKASSGNPITIVMYDSLMHWVLQIVHNQGLKGAAFFTQACVIYTIYNHVRRGTLKVPLETTTVSLPAIPVLEANDLPSFVYNPSAYPSSLDIILSENLNLDQADWLFFNTFDKLEDEVVRWLAGLYPIRTIGPSTPSFYVDKQLEDDKDYTISLFKSSTEACIKWLDTKETNSVVYVSFGSLSNLRDDQMEEIAWGLVRSNYNFLWVVRSSEQDEVPDDLLSAENQERGLIVNWCPQLEVLAHEAVGCFMSHCGWNSTMEALCLGVPMVAMPVWIDQTTNSKFIVDVWQTGIRVKAGNEGTVSREEVEMAIKEVMHGDLSSELHSNALKWKEMAKEAISQGGSSDKHIEEFVITLNST